MGLIAWRCVKVLVLLHGAVLRRGSYCMALCYGVGLIAWRCVKVWVLLYGVVIRCGPYCMALC